MSKSTSSSGGGGFVGLLTLLFIGLKLCHVIDWSWWWVLAPSWITFLVAFCGFFTFILFKAMAQDRAGRK